MDEFLHLGASCVVQPQRENRFKVILFDLTGRREAGFKSFETVRDLTTYLQFRTIRIENSAKWRRLAETRNRRLKLDFKIRHLRPQEGEDKEDANYYLDKLKEKCV